MNLESLRNSKFETVARKANVAVIRHKATGLFSVMVNNGQVWHEMSIHAAEGAAFFNAQKYLV